MQNFKRMDVDKHPTIIMPLLHPRLNAYILCGRRSGSTLLMNILAVHPAIRALSTSSLTKWRNTLSDTQAAEISRIYGSIYAQFNPPV